MYRRFVASAAVIVLLIGLSLHQADGLQCWACSSDIDRSCADIFNTSDILRYGGGGFYQSGYQSGYNSQYDPYNSRPYDNRDNRNYRDPNSRDPYFDRDRNRDRDYNRDYNNRDYNNRDYNNRDSNNRDYNNRDNRDPYFDRDNRDPYSRDPNNNRDYNNRDYNNRDYNQQGRNYDSQYPPRDYNYQRSQALAQSQSGGPRLVTCNEEEARLRRMRNVCVKKVQRIGEHQVTYIRRCEMIPIERDVGTCYDPVARGISLDFCEYCQYDGCNSASGLNFNLFLASLVSLVTLLSFWS